MRKTEFHFLFIVLYLPIVIGVVLFTITFASYEDINFLSGSIIDTAIIIPEPKIVQVKVIQPELLKPKAIKPLPTPKKVKGIYLTGYTFADNLRRNELIKFIEKTELNTIVVDLKDPNGGFIFHPADKKLQLMPISPVALGNVEFTQILTDLQEKEIYTIARIITFQDNTVDQAFPNEVLKNKSGGVWRNYGGVAWLDPTNPNSWEIPVTQAKEAAKLGFDEIQFDYIRFPSDGNTNQIQYHNPPNGKKRYQILTDFYKYLTENLKELEVPLSADLFGLTYQLQDNPEYDLGIGQRLSDVCLYFDYVSPMVYPSHYPGGYLGFSNPAVHPYAVVNQSLQDGNYILENILQSKSLNRPWLQDFSMGAVYNIKMIKDQIRACDENNTAGWLLWNPRNVYTFKALEPAE